MKRDKGIKLSPKHGVNPCIPGCFWCGQLKNEIALLGLLPNDQEAPFGIILDYEPCDECKAKWEEGVVILEVTDTPNQEGQPPIRRDAYPTGNYLVVDATNTQTRFKKGDRTLMYTADFQELSAID